MENHIFHAFLREKARILLGAPLIRYTDHVRLVGLRLGLFYFVRLSFDNFGSDNIGCDSFGSDSIGCDSFGSDNIGSDNISSDSIGSDSFGPDNIGSDNKIFDKNIFDNFGSDNIGCDSFGSDSIGCDSFGSDNKIFDKNKFDKKVSYKIFLTKLVVTIMWYSQISHYSVQGFVIFVLKVPIKTISAVDLVSSSKQNKCRRHCGAAIIAIFLLVQKYLVYLQASESGKYAFCHLLSNP